MKKALIISLSVLAGLLIIGAVLLFVLWGGSSKHYSAIPDGSVYLVKVNAGNLLKDSEILEQPIVETVLDMVVKSMPRSSRELMREIVENPSASGIDVDQPAVFAITDVQPMKGVFVMAVKDKARLEEVITLFTEDFNEIELEENDGVTYIGFGNRNRVNEVSIAYDADKFVVAMADRYADAEEYFNLEGDEQAVNNKAYSRFFDKNDDAAMYLDFSTITEMKGLRLSRSEKQLLKTFEDMTMFMSLNFDNGYAELLAAVELPEEYKETIEENWVEPTHRHFKYIPENAIGVACIGVDFEKILEMESMEKPLKSLSKEGFSKGVLSSVYGDVTFAVLPVEKLGKEDIPQFMFVADCNDRALFDQIVRMIKEEEGVSYIDDDVYALGMNKYREYNNYYWDDYSYTEKEGGYDYYFMYRDNAIFFLPENIYRKLVEDDEVVALDESIANSDKFSALKGAGLIADFDGIVEAITDVAGRMSSSERKVVEFVELFENAQLVVDSPFEVRARIELDDKDDNFLKVLVEEIFSIFSKEIMSEL